MLSVLDQFPTPEILDRDSSLFKILPEENHFVWYPKPVSRVLSDTNSDKKVGESRFYNLSCISFNGLTSSEHQFFLWTSLCPVLLNFVWQVQIQKVLFKKQQWKKSVNSI